MSIRLNQIEEFLLKVDSLFPTPLSNKCELKLLAQKFVNNATICAKIKENKIVALVAGYTNDSINKIAYISVVATLPEVQGKGYASKLIRDFLNISFEKKIKAVHLYSDINNKPAISMYKRLGFIEWNLSDEIRKSDVHFIYKF